MTEPSEMIAWLDGRIASAMTWLDDHGRAPTTPAQTTRSKPRNTTLPVMRRSRRRM
ncbi:hypothetical protein FHX06_007225 [Rhizobium sp. BK512]|nr:hypothetical protein [Rhizobium sp. BK512]